MSDGDENEDGHAAAGGGHLGDDFDPEELGDGVSGDLSGYEDGFEIDVEEGGVGVRSGGEGFTEGIHAEVGTEGGDDTPDGPADV